MAGTNILVVDDSIDDLGLVCKFLKNAGYQVITARDGQEALRLLHEQRPALVILDVGFGRDQMDGYTICKRIRELNEGVPILIVTGREGDRDVLRGFEVGADDYIFKSRVSKNSAELIARVKANIRRASIEPTVYGKRGLLYSDGFLTVNTEERRVMRDGKQVKLTPTEFNLLMTLIEHAPRVVPYKEILKQVWGFEYIDDIEYLRVYIWHLRRKLEPDSKDPIYIVNETAVGYRFEKQPF